MVEEFFTDLRSVKRRKQSTVRRYQNALRMFCSYVSDPDYCWDRVCEQRFGGHPAQGFFEWNTATHVQDNEESPAKRAFAKRELQDFFDHADDQVALIAASGRCGPRRRGSGLCSQFDPRTTPCKPRRSAIH
jgi:integrase/recombinase XerD